MITHFILFYNCKHLLSKFTSVPMIRTQSAFKMDAIGVRAVWVLTLPEQTVWE